MYITVSRAFRPWASDVARAEKESEKMSEWVSEYERERERERENENESEHTRESVYKRWVYIWLDGGINNLAGGQSYGSRYAEVAAVRWLKLAHSYDRSPRYIVTRIRAIILPFSICFLAIEILSRWDQNHKTRRITKINYFFSPSLLYKRV